MYFSLCTIFANNSLKFTHMGGKNPPQFYLSVAKHNWCFFSKAAWEMTESRCIPVE